jgi:hypothetical protein
MPPIVVAALPARHAARHRRRGGRAGTGAVRVRSHAGVARVAAAHARPAPGGNTLRRRRPHRPRGLPGTQHRGQSRARLRRGHRRRTHLRSAAGAGPAPVRGPHPGNAGQLFVPRADRLRAGRQGAGCRRLWTHRNACRAHRARLRDESPDVRPAPATASLDRPWHRLRWMVRTARAQRRPESPRTADPPQLSLGSNPVSCCSTPHAAR